MSDRVDKRPEKPLIADDKTANLDLLRELKQPEVHDRAMRKGREALQESLPERDVSTTLFE